MTTELSAHNAARRGGESGIRVSARSRARTCALTVAMVSLTVAAGICFAADEPPAWAYVIAPAPAAAQAAAPASSQKYRLDGSNLLVTRAEINDAFGPAGWFPRDHPPMPGIVAHGRGPDVLVAYVPIGSIKKGQALVTTGAGKTKQCAVCHGEDLKGLGPVPGIAGRSPSYLVRQMCDMQQDARKGVWASLMKPVVATLSQDDMLAIAAYLSWRMQSPAPAPSCRAGQPCPGTLRYP